MPFNSDKNETLEEDDGYLKYLEDMCLGSKNKLIIESYIEVCFYFLGTLYHFYSTKVKGMAWVISEFLITKSSQAQGRFHLTRDF